MTYTAGIIGGGVIGAGWAARFLLNGWNVRVFDDDPDAARRIEEVIDHARRSLPGIYDVVLPAEGNLCWCDSIEAAATGADWIQESVPERLDLKQGVYQQLQQTAPDEAVIGSSTSGFKPSELAEGAVRPGQILVAHPFNPVYLLPLVEVVAHPNSSLSIVQRAFELLEGIGMQPLRVRSEIDAHIADRLLEAVWRESLWLVHDDVATAGEIDDAIRFGFGIRWAQMGLFETYRTAGGEAGMAHFIAQFGPALKWPWTRLTDVPDLSDELIDKIAAQCDEHSAHRSVRETIRIRDNNLVAILRALKKHDWGAGHTIREHDRLIAARATDGEIDWAAPIRTHARAIPLDWVDYNGHMNEAHYLELFSRGSDRLLELIGCDADYVAAHGSYFTAETHLRHLSEAHPGDRVHVLTQCLEGQGKKLHLFQSLRRDDQTLLATGEHIMIHVSLESRRSAPPTPAIADKLASIMALQGRLPVPDGVGRAIGRRSAS